MALTMSRELPETLSTLPAKEMASTDVRLDRISPMDQAAKRGMKQARNRSDEQHHICSLCL